MPRRGIVHALLDPATWDDILGHPVAGGCWEGFVLETLIAVAVEITRGTAPEVSKGFRLACEVLKPRAAYVVHGGTERWPMAGGVQAISLLELAAHLSEGS